MVDNGGGGGGRPAVGLVDGVEVIWVLRRLQNKVKLTHPYIAFG